MRPRDGVIKEPKFGGAVPMAVQITWRFSGDERAAGEQPVRPSCKDYVRSYTRTSFHHQPEARADETID